MRVVKADGTVIVCRTNPDEDRKRGTFKCASCGNKWPDKAAAIACAEQDHRDKWGDLLVEDEDNVCVPALCVVGQTDGDDWCDYEVDE